MTAPRAQTTTFGTAMTSRSIGELKDIVAAGNILYSTEEIGFAHDLLATKMMLKTMIEAWDEAHHRYRAWPPTNVGMRCVECGGGPPGDRVHWTSGLVLLDAGFNVPTKAIFDPDNGYHDPRTAAEQFDIEKINKTIKRENRSVERDESGAVPWRRKK